RATAPPCRTSPSWFPSVRWSSWLHDSLASAPGPTATGDSRSKGCPPAPAWRSWRSRRAAGRASPSISPPAIARAYSSFFRTPESPAPRWTASGVRAQKPRGRAAPGAPPGAWSAISYSDERGRFRIEGLTAGPLTVSAIHETGFAEVSGGLLEEGARKDVEVILTGGTSVSGTVRRQDGLVAAGAQVFAFAGGWGQSPWGQPTAATKTAVNGGYRIESLPPGEVLLRAVNVGDDPFAGLGSRQARLDRGSLLVRPGVAQVGGGLGSLKNR